MELSSERTLRAAISEELARNPNSPDREIGLAVNRAQPAVVADWAMGKLTALARLVRKGGMQPDPSQMAFAFHDLSVHIPVKEGKVELRGATIGMLRQADLVLSKKKKAGIENPRPNSLHGRIRREIELMEPYSYASRKITLEKVHELVASGIPAPTPQRTGMSEAMRRYWAQKTAAERSAIARRRQAKRRRAARQGKGPKQ